MSTAESKSSVLTVAQLSWLIKDALESRFPSLWVGGEISDLAQPKSGHIYLTLKDDDAQIRGVIWRSTASRLPFELKDGQQVICQASVDVYPPRGVYQLIIRNIEPQGLGKLQLALKQLQQKLHAEGLFDPRHKQPLPAFPRRIAFVTSPTGAAIRDFLEVVRRRWKAIEVLVIPANVQGAAAAPEIVRGIQVANQLRPAPDVLVVGRGGGSMEDLWCFNDERVVREVFASSIPVVSAVGNGIDVTLCDLVADVRALTPSEAAELVVPSLSDVEDKLRHLRQHLVRNLQNRAAQSRSQLEALSRHRAFRRPLDRIHDLQRRLDECEARAVRAVRLQRQLAERSLTEFAARLETLSPLAVLSRGYSVTQSEQVGVIHDSNQVRPGDTITTRLARGVIQSKVTETK